MGYCICRYKKPIASRECGKEVKAKGGGGMRGTVSFLVFLFFYREKIGP